MQAIYFFHVYNENTSQFLLVVKTPMMQLFAQLFVLCSIYSSTGLSLSAPVEKLVEAPPTEFTPNTTPGGGGSKYIDPPRFRIYNYTTTTVANTALTILEAAYTCFVEDLGWHSTGLTFNTAAGGELNDSGPYYKLIQRRYLDGSSSKHRNRFYNRTLIPKRRDTIPHHALHHSP
jgi:hypothetical protein